jgi:hypothetical protein
MADVVQPTGQLQCQAGTRLFCQAATLPSVRQMGHALTRMDAASGLLVESDDVCAAEIHRRILSLSDVKWMTDGLEDSGFYDTDLR